MQWECDTYPAVTDRATTKQMQDGDSECKDSESKDQEEQSNLADDTNDDRDEMAHILVDSELKQLTDGEEGKMLAYASVMMKTRAQIFPLALNLQGARGRTKLRS